MQRTRGSHPRLLNKNSVLQNVPGRNPQASLRVAWEHTNTIVPGGVQGLDCYAYANNNALRYTDPTGHLGKDNTILPEGGGGLPQPPDTAVLTDGGKEIQKLFEKYKYTKGWWNNYVSGAFTYKQFLILILGFELSPLIGVALTSEEVMEFRHSTTHWFYSQAAAWSGATCELPTPNAILTFLAENSESAWLYYHAIITNGLSPSEVTIEKQVNIELATKIVSSIFNPPAEWRRTGLGQDLHDDRYWGGKWDPVAEHPFYWGNAILFKETPSTYVFKYGAGKSAFYILTANEASAVKK
jgi:hypothetical protein